MSDVLFYITAFMFITCIIATLICWLFNMKKRKSYNSLYSITDEALGNIEKLDTIIETCVGSVNNKMVASMKMATNFFQSDKEEALNECKNMVSTMTNSDTIEEIKTLGLDLDAWINARIEYFVRKQKLLK